jgi:DNA (cytosine-5)-methyltransferase 1
MVAVCGQGGKDLAGTITAGFGGNKMGAPEVDAGLYIPVAHALTASRSSTQCPNEDTTLIPMISQPVAFDTTQITSAANFSNPQPGDPCHPLAAQAHVPAVVIPINDMATHHAGTDGSGNQNGKGHGLGIGGEFDPMFTLTKGDRHAVAHPIPINSMNALRSADADPSTGCGIGEAGEAMFTITKAHSHAVAFDWKMGAKARSIAINHEQAPTLGMQADRYAVQQAMQVRRLTPVECERLQGFPDNYTDIKAKGKPTPDGPRYKALGNSMAVPVMAWIGKRIQENLQNTAS